MLIIGLLGDVGGPSIDVHLGKLLLDGRTPGCKLSYIEAHVEACGGSTWQRGGLDKVAYLGVHVARGADCHDACMVCEDLICKRPFLSR